MPTFPAGYLAHIRSDATTLTLCWHIEKRNGYIITGTEHDEDLTISTATGVEVDLDGLYLASAGITGSELRVKGDMSVDNMQVEGALDAAGFDIDINSQDVEAGLLDNAAVTFFLVNWQDADQWQDIRERGYLGEISRTSEGLYRTELRGLQQRLQQQIGRTLGERCDVKEFGDARCKIDADALSVQGTVTTVTSRRRFNSTLDLGSQTPANGYFETGKFIFATGQNAGFKKQVKFDSVGGVLGRLSLWDALPYDPAPGDIFTIWPGCNRNFSRCQFFNNTINFRGHGRWIPGIPKISRAP